MFGFEIFMVDVVKDFIMIYGDFMVLSVENKVYGEVVDFNKVWKDFNIICDFWVRSCKNL